MSKQIGWLCWLVVAACSWAPTHYEDQTFACTSSADCLDTYTCVNQLCVKRAEGTGGGAAATGGGPATGGGVATGGGLSGTGGGGESTGGGGGTFDDAGVGGGAATGGGGVSCADRTEICGDTIDDNCNGILDDGCECDAGRPCYPNAADIFGSDLSAPQLAYPWDGGAGCSPGVQACIGGHLQQSCTGLHVPVSETCDGRDNDCDGVIDSLLCPCSGGRECYPGAPFTQGIGVCKAGTWNCALPLGTQCVGVNIGAIEVCNGLDDDCNGLVDDGIMPTTPCGPGVCVNQFKTCADGGEVACVLSSIPGFQVADTCGDGLDNNCNGAVDEGCSCVSGSMQTCFPGPAAACDGGSCYGVCKKGSQSCVTSSDGGLGYNSCTGFVVPSAEQCSDSFDNDCDNKVDCADSDCTARSCGANGRVCFSGSCQCIFDGGVSTTEICTDKVDNNCNGSIDCVDSLCANKACGPNGKTCVGTTCTCVVDGGTVQPTETLCADGLDNDCDGLVDCAQTSCSGQSCGPNNKTCQQNVCTCLTDGGVPQTTETLCTDGVDNDCDGLVDCLDPNCAASCGTTETNCSDGLDNDGDGKKDCADPDCLHKVCGAAGSVCCSTSATGCTNLTNDPANCGQCGATCSSGTCTPATSGSHTSGRCGCVTSADCPMPQPGRTRQSCAASSLCTCGDDNDQCAPSSGGRCSLTVCYYP